MSGQAAGKSPSGATPGCVTGSAKKGSPEGWETLHSPALAELCGTVFNLSLTGTSSCQLTIIPKYLDSRNLQKQEMEAGRK